MWCWTWPWRRGRSYSRRWCSCRRSRWSRTRCSTWRGRWRYSRRRRRCGTANEIELTDARGEIEAVVWSGVVFVHVPEGHAIGGINGGHAVVAPASEGIQLAARASKHGSLTLAEVI
jgi:hypothetical protein